MSRISKTLVVERNLGDEMERIVRDIEPDTAKDGVEFDKEVTFCNGMRMAIQVCGPGNPKEESCWTQGVLFGPQGNELGCTDVGESFLGEYCITFDGDDYIVNVELENSCQQ